MIHQGFKTSNMFDKYVAEIIMFYDYEARFESLYYLLVVLWTTKLEFSNIWLVADAAIQQLKPLSSICPFPLF